MRAQRVATLLAIAATLAATGADVHAQSGPVRVLSSNGFRAVLDDVGPSCERTIGRTVSAQFGTSTSLRQRVDANETFDVAIMTREAIDDLVKTGKVVASTRTGLGRSGIGIGVRAGSPKPDIRNADALKRTFTSAKSVSYAGDGASRPHIERMMTSLGIADLMTKKTILEQGSVRAAARVAAGDAELLITLVSEIMSAPGVDLVGPLPAEFQNYVSFAAAVSAQAGSGDAGKALISCLSGPSVAATLKAKGMEKP